MYQVFSCCNYSVTLRYGVVACFSIVYLFYSCFYFVIISASLFIYLSILFINNDQWHLATEQRFVAIFRSRVKFSKYHNDFYIQLIYVRLN